MNLTTLGLPSLETWAKTPIFSQNVANLGSCTNGLKLFSRDFQRNLDLSANIYATKRAVDKRNEILKLERVNYKLSKFSELWPTNG